MPKKYAFYLEISFYCVQWISQRLIAYYKLSQKIMVFCEHLMKRHFEVANSQKLFINFKCITMKLKFTSIISIIYHFIMLLLIKQNDNWQASFINKTGIQVSIKRFWIWKYKNTIKNENWKFMKLIMKTMLRCALAWKPRKLFHFQPNEKSNVGKFKNKFSNFFVVFFGGVENEELFWPISCFLNF